MEGFYQYSVFDYDKKPLAIDKPIRLIELFAGIGSQAKALERIGADFEHYRVCEFDKYAIASYNAIHGTNFETSDITKLKGGDLGIKDLDKFTYIMTYSFPCQ
jgi:DNA (cytosine-5)-methyltransferase 1